MIDKALIKEAKKRLYTLSLCCLCVDSEDEELLKVNSVEITKLIKDNINIIFNSNEKLEALFDKEGLINSEHLHDAANEIAKIAYYKLFNLPYILEINASELCLDTDDIAKDEDKLSELVYKHLCDNYESRFNSFKIEDVCWNENKEFSSVKVIVDWDITE